MEDVLTYALPLFVLFIAAEILLSAREHMQLYSFKDTKANILLGLFALVSGTAAKWWSFKVFTFCHGLLDIDLGNAWWVILLCFIADDFVHYLFHRFGHRFRIGWASHVTHHSSKHYNLSIAVRLPLHLIYRFVFWIPLSLVFDPALLLFTDAVSQIYQFFIHTEVIRKLPKPIEFIFNTPSHHRVHHASNPRYIDKNFGGIFILWDRMFGTFEPETEKCVYGITKHVDTTNAVTVASHGWVELFRGAWKQRSLLTGFRYLFGRPD
jgi:sterol desaturase/sphingolipid hydroxylase (fatty acid hydroxylase superfamily)